jgi:hypothetical protein
MQKAIFSQSSQGTQSKAFLTTKNTKGPKKARIGAVHLVHPVHAVHIALNPEGMQCEKTCYHIDFRKHPVYSTIGTKHMVTLA